MPSQSTTSITPSILYALLKCPHRVARDWFADSNERDPVSGFARLLWAQGSEFEYELVAGLEDPFTDLSSLAGDKKELATHEAIRRGDALIYQGRLSHEDLLGEPDLLLS